MVTPHRRNVAAVVIMMIIKSFSTHVLASPAIRRVVPGGFSYKYRLATKNDIPSITSVNVMSLPENYSREYYQRHMVSWSTLSVVAESDDNKIIGYALGRLEVEDRSVGHVSSIAVLNDYRGKGVGKDMMQMLHEQFVNVHNVDTVSLYCRVSNQNAINLYIKLYDYKGIKIIEEYYDDGENALLMRVDNLIERVKKEPI